MKVTKKQLNLLNLTEAEAKKIAVKTLKRMLKEAAEQEKLQTLSGVEYDDLGDPIVSPTQGKSAAFNAADKINKAGGNTAHQETPDEANEEEDAEVKATTSSAEDDEKEVTEEDEVEVKTTTSSAADDDEKVEVTEEDDAEEADKTSEEDDDEEEVDEEEDVKIEVTDAEAPGGEKHQETPAEANEEDEEDENKKSSEEDVKVDVEEDVKALMTGESLNEEFQVKAKAIFESAVKRGIKKNLKPIKESLNKKFAKKVASNHKKLVEQVDSYLDYVVKEWMTENKLAIDNGLRTEIAEEFIGGLKKLFTESAIEVPQTKVNLVDKLAEQTVKLKNQLNHQMKQNIKLQEEISGKKRTMMIKEACENLTQSQVEKFTDIVKDVSYTSEKDFALKLAQLKESYFPKAKKSSAKNLNEVSNPVEDSIDPDMDKYVEAAKNFGKAD